LILTFKKFSCNFSYGVIVLKSFYYKFCCVGDQWGLRQLSGWS